jgi:ComF family protein
METDELCEDCREANSPLGGMRSAALHLPPFEQAVQALKYEGLRALAEPLGEVLAQCWSRAPYAATVVLPVPLHAARLRQRGYNQSLLLAREFARRVDLPVQGDVLVRERNTRSQVGLSGNERQANVSGAFRCRSDALRGEKVLLIDDVLTTGATLEACAGALGDAGVDGVWALTVTRAVGPRSGGPGDDGKPHPDVQRA